MHDPDDDDSCMTESNTDDVSDMNRSFKKERTPTSCDDDNDIRFVLINVYLFGHVFSNPGMTIQYIERNSLCLHWLFCLFLLLYSYRLCRKCIR